MEQNNKFAHIYNLKVNFVNGVKWDLDILAVSVTWLFCWIQDEHHVKEYKVELIKENAERVKPDFGARSLTSNVTHDSQYKRVESAHPADIAIALSEGCPGVL